MNQAEPVPHGPQQVTSLPSKTVLLGVVVAALGYFVDVYDLVLFSIVRRPSLLELGVAEGDLVGLGVYLLNMQMVGMLVGGILFGVWGDKRGRLSVLFGSILLYSVANILNGMVQNVSAYAWLRFIAGVGLAGELGAGITLVSETTSRTGRGYGTTFVATIGVAGAIIAALVAEFTNWRTAYYVGGVMGLALLFLRVAVAESGMFEALREKSVSRGDLRLLFRRSSRAVRYLLCILAGVPVWYCVGILITFSPEIARALGLAELPTGGRAILYSYIGFVLGDLASGLLSQLCRSRRTVLFLFNFLLAIATCLFLTVGGRSLATLYLLCGVVGFCGGYWAVIVTVAAEQFGTNLRATVATTVPNFIRGSTVLVTLLFRFLLDLPDVGILLSAGIVGALCIAISLTAVYFLPESFGNDLNFVEE